MRKDDDFPYCVHRGFPDEFVHADTPLCARRADGTVIRNGNGTPVLACTCGMVLGGQAYPELTYFTEGGSFWTNHFPELFQPGRDPRTCPRDTCRSSGYQSMALIPIRSGREILGLLQLHDSKAGRLDLQMIRLFECLAGQIGLALRCRRAEEELYKSEEQLRLSIEHAPTNIAMFDRNMCYLAASRRWLEDHNLAGKPFVGLNLYETADRSRSTGSRSISIVFRAVSRRRKKSTHRSGRQEAMVALGDASLALGTGSGRWNHYFQRRDNGGRAARGTGPGAGCSRR